MSKMAIKCSGASADFIILQHLLDDNSESEDGELPSESQHNIIQSTYFSSSSSENEMEECKTPKKLQKISDYLETICRYDDETFKSNFRLKRYTCDYLIEKITQDKILPRHTFGREKISPMMAVYVTLYYLGNTKTFRQVSAKFHITMSSVHRIVSKVVDYLVEKSPEYIHWPDEESRTRIKKGYFELNEINGILGAIGVKHINIKKPGTQHAYAYCNGKDEYSILMQAVCDHQMRFLDVFAGEAGAMHPARLLKRTSLYQKGLNGFFANDFLLGDSAYPCLNWLITPFTDNGNLTRDQQTFNCKHSESQVVIEHAYGLLKSRFRRLQHFENNDLVFVTKCAIAASVLHNICIDFDDNIDFELDHVDGDYDEQYVQNVSGIAPDTKRRDKLFLFI